MDTWFRKRKVDWNEIVLWEIHTMHVVDALNWESWSYMWSVVGNIKKIETHGDKEWQMQGVFYRSRLDRMIIFLVSYFFSISCPSTQNAFSIKSPKKKNGFIGQMSVSVGMFFSLTLKSHEKASDCIFDFVFAVP